MQDTKKTDGMTLFFTDLDRDRIEIRPIRKMGRNAVNSNEVFIDDLHVPDADRVGEEGKGFRYLLDGLNPERMLVAVEASASAAALRRAVRYGNERVVFDADRHEPRSRLPARRLARPLDAAVLMARKAAWLYDAGKPCGREANMAKYLCSNAGFEAADRAVQSMAVSATPPNITWSVTSASRGWRIAPISNEMVLNYVAEHVMGLPRSY